MVLDYWCAIFTRDGEKTLQTTLESIFQQSAQPTFVIVVNDGSTDGTRKILEKLNSDHKNLYVINNGSKTRDIRRAPVLVNMCLKQAEFLPQTEFMMISGDDTYLPSNYASSIMEKLHDERDIVIASGSLSGETTPHGTGRFVKNEYMRRIGGRYPVAYGWEAWLLFKASQLGLGVKVYQDIHYQHLRPFQGRNAYNWGKGMYNLGYPAYFAFARALKILLTRRRTLGAKGAASIMAGYLSLRFSQEKGLVLKDNELRKYVSYSCNSRVFGALSKILTGRLASSFS